MCGEKTSGIVRLRLTVSGTVNIYLLCVLYKADVRDELEMRLLNPAFIQETSNGVGGAGAVRHCA